MKKVRVTIRLQERADMPRSAVHLDSAHHALTWVLGQIGWKYNDVPSCSGERRITFKCKPDHLGPVYESCRNLGRQVVVSVFTHWESK